MASPAVEQGETAKPVRIVQVRRYEIFNTKEHVLVTSTAEWCVPCGRIKPHLETLEKQGKLKSLSMVEMDREKMKPGLKIPFFELVDVKSEKALRSIQTSKSEELEVFLDFDMLQFDDDF